MILVTGGLSMAGAHTVRVDMPVARCQRCGWFRLNHQR
jgi:hypothetical protein